MAKIPQLGRLHNIRVNDAAYFLVQKKIIEAREKGSILTPVEIVSNLILNTQRI
ncbi:MAG: hypothetical protein J6W54_04040 [Fibrobacter sp.]|uniref:hypothetical protein n=1 Tax=Fibrobacter sp. TaxID=35828 RepID=UPI001B225827|nr:hypothetical protein [Fibrobacter sp.]MBO7060251.1 hypothetical protein [Fibrobacter sp.]